jgi:hypothetical protein
MVGLKFVFVESLLGIKVMLDITIISITDSSEPILIESQHLNLIALMS